MEANPSSSSSSSSSSLPPVKTYDVFLSFRGEDIRNNFMSHLSGDLRKIGLFSIFKDDIVLPKGKDTDSELMKAIEDSHYAVVVISERYATSTWCLKELAKIVECMGDSGRIRTIFYHVNPSHLRNVISSDAEKQQESSFWKALKEHAKNPSNSKYLESWRNALVKVANQFGDPVDAHTDEAIFIKTFVADISSKLGAPIRTIDGLVGMTSRLLDLDSHVLQPRGTNNACFIGITGMGGIGKSTLAALYFKKMSHKYDGCSFLPNVREVCRKEVNGLLSLQKKLLKDILEENFEQIGHTDYGIDMIRSRLCKKKVLIVLDDVSELNQLNGLAGEDNWFKWGSVILVTTRDETALNRGRYTIYRAKLLSRSEALQLFSSKAFGSIEPPEEYKKLSELVLEYTGYLPLALIVLGSLLRGKTTSEWESALRRLKNCPEKKIFEMLKIGFDDVNKVDQRIFLDIACFFNGFDKDDVEQILDSCGFEPIYGIRNLIDKSLLSIYKDKYRESMILMHDLLQEMGKEIVREESGNELGRQSRIWDADDLYHILGNREEAKEVEAIVTPLDGGKKYRFEALSFMKKLRLLKISEPYGFAGLDDFECDGPEFPYNLQYLEWGGFPFTKLTSSFRKLVHLKLWGSKLRQLCWKGIEPLHYLKVIDLSHCAHFTKFEDFSVFPNLEKLILRYCLKLSEIHPSIEHLKRLILLDLSYCESLENFPKEINGLISLRELILYHCRSLKNFPEEINGLTSLQILDLFGCRILAKLPYNLEQLKSLWFLDTRLCFGIKHLPPSIFLLENIKLIYCDMDLMGSTIRDNIIGHSTIDKCFLLSSFLARLTRLDLSDCNLTGLEAFSEYFGKLDSLEYLDLSKNLFSVLPPGINGLYNLRKLWFEHCKSLTLLDADLLPSSLRDVNVNYCISLASFLDPLKPSRLRCSTVYCLECTELVKRQDGKMTALASLTRFLDQDTNARRYREFKFVVPQSDNELPSWFINQSSVPSITIKSDPNRHNSKLIGLAMVFCFGPNSSMDDKIYCKIRFPSSKETTLKLDGFGSRMSDHLFLLYSGSETTLLLSEELGDPGTAVKLSSCVKELQQLSSWDTLEFSFFSDHGSSCGPCGVRLVYEEDIEELKQITSNYINDQKDVQSSHSQSWREPKNRRPELEDNLVLAKRQSR